MKKSDLNWWQSTFFNPYIPFHSIHHIRYKQQRIRYINLIQKTKRRILILSRNVKSIFKLNFSIWIHELEPVGPGENIAPIRAECVDRCLRLIRHLNAGWRCLLWDCLTETRFIWLDTNGFNLSLEPRSPGPSPFKLIKVIILIILYLVGDLMVSWKTNSRQLRKLSGRNSIGGKE